MISKIFMPLHLLLVISMILMSCAKTHETGQTEPKGFISDVSMLQEDPEGKFTLVYIKEDADFASYDKLWLETITVYVYEGSKLAKMPKEDLNQLVDYIKVALERELGKDYQIVNEGGPGVMQFRFALTEIVSSNTLLDTVSTVVPQMRAFSELKKLVTGRHLAVGRAAFEGEALDAETGERLAAAIGVRSGGKTLKKKTYFGKYRDIEAAIDVWAANIRGRFERLRQQSAGQS